MTLSKDEPEIAMLNRVTDLLVDEHTKIMSVRFYYMPSIN